MQKVCHLNVIQLRQKLREAGLPTSGNKAKLIERWYENQYSEKFSSALNDSVERRLNQLESAMQSVRVDASEVGTMPLSASSPTPVVHNSRDGLYVQDHMSGRAVPEPTNMPVHIDQQDGRMREDKSTLNSIFAQAATPVQRRVQFSEAYSREAERNCRSVAGAVTSPLAYRGDNSTPYSFSHVADAERNENWYNSFATMRTDSGRGNTMPTYACSHSVSTPFHCATRSVNDNHFISNGFGNVCDIMKILPTFDPSDKSMSSTQFVGRIEQLLQVYGWNEKVLLFAVQANLKGAAKMWIDSVPIVYVNWSRFVEEFLNQFPSIINSADVHMELMNMRRGTNESPDMFYYRVLAKGHQGGVDNQAIIKYVINGLNDTDMKRCLSVTTYGTCNDLLRAISNYCAYNSTRNCATVKQAVPDAQNKRSTNEKKTKTEIICYNCRKSGHISRECTEEKRRPKCEKCGTIGHRGSECVKQKTKSENCNAIEDEVVKFTVKTILLYGKEVDAFVDTGSARSLIRKSVADKFDDCHKEKCYVRLKGFGGGVYECQNKVKVMMKIDSAEESAWLLIVDNNMIANDVLLGRDVLCSGKMKYIIDGENLYVHADVVKNVNAIDAKSEAGRFGELDKLLCKHEKRFSTLGKANVVKMDIKLTTDKPINMKPYRLPFAKRPIVNTIIRDLLDKNIIRASNSPFASPIVLVAKKNNEYRMCVDYRQLNRVTVKQPFPMPIMDELFAVLAGNRYFTVLDLNMGYHQIEVDESTKQFTAFVTNDGHYEYNRMPFGLVNAPAVFQTMMNRLCEQMKPRKVIAYLDDVIIPSATVSEGLEILHEFLDLLEKTSLTLRRDKCKFLATEINFLGHKVNENGITPGECKVRAIHDFPVPSTATKVRRFLGLTGFFRKFVKNYAAIARPLNQLTTKNAMNNFVWGEAAANAFNSLIQSLTCEPVLTLYDFNALHEVHTDASSVGIAGVFLQSTDEGRTWNAVMYFSRRCTDLESRYHSYELEVLAVVEALQRFRVHLLGKPFRVVTDCAAISNVKAKSELIPRIARWWMRLGEYDFECVHRPGVRMSHVDALSRSPVGDERNEDESVLPIALDTEDWLLTMQIQDTKIREIVDVLRGTRKSEQVKHLKN
ncbi:PREDICTED: uncharacterized protein LOC108375015 [Rhagoletis zephyria]|uniref:uncharacterized protein LOC108375015 n=1 Tax=Rhagoletis zephyria TaxID=28612 RepID=UPI000811252A|nr:PREDICTED: uncharacterized protein LOC108375015 [Rhagoletis zephyria]